MARILIVDDERFMRLTLRRVLETDGHEIVGEAANGLEAVVLYSQLKPDLVTMDITMPEMDGIEAVAKICSQDPNAIIIICSAMGQTHMVTQALKNGARDFIVKPFNPDRIKNSLERVLNREL